MTDTTLVNSTIDTYLNTRYSQIIHSFGSLANLYYYARLKYQNVDEFYYNILNFRDDIVLLTPDNIRFTLSNNQDSQVLINTNINLPYSVYNDRGEMLYRVTNHRGIFGDSILDRQLVFQSNLLDYYYLRYSTFTGDRVLIMMIGLFGESVYKTVLSEGELLDTTANEILPSASNISTMLFLVDGVQNVHVSGIQYPVRMIYVPGAPSSSIDRSTLSTSPEAQTSMYDMSVISSFSFNPTTSGFIFFYQDVPGGSIPLYISSLTGTGHERVLNASQDVYYFSFSNEYSLDLLRQIFNLLDTPFPAFTPNTSFNLTATLSNIYNAHYNL